MHSRGRVEMNRKPGKKREKRTGSIGAMAPGLLLMGIFIGLLLFSTWCRFECTQVLSDISTANERQDRLMALQEELRLELARLKSPERLTRIAETSMGLRMATPRQMMVME